MVITELFSVALFVRHWAIGEESLGFYQIGYDISPIFGHEEEGGHLFARRL